MIFQLIHNMQLEQGEALSIVEAVAKPLHLQGSHLNGLIMHLAIDKWGFKVCKIWNLHEQNQIHM